MRDRFDISAGGQAYQKGDLSWTRGGELVILVLGVALASFGAFSQAGYAGPPSARGGFDWVLVVMGALLGLLAIVQLLTLPRVASSLEISEEMARLRFPDGTARTVAWKDPQLCIDIADGRGVPKERRVAALKDVDFVLTLRPRAIAVVPPEAVRLLLTEARAHDLEVSGWEDHVQVPGPARVVRIRPRATSR